MLLDFRSDDIYKSERWQTGEIDLCRTQTRNHTPKDCELAGLGGRRAGM